MSVKNKQKIIKEFQYRKHHILPDGEIDPISLYIDCWDQILYTILMNFEIDPLRYFYGSILPEYYENSAGCGLRRIEEDANRAFLVEPLMVSEGDNISVMEQSICENIPVSMITMFDMLPNYDWYKEGVTGDHNGHSNLIVGYDSDNLYVIDSPLVFVKERDTTAQFNETIHLIERKYIQKALSIYCDLKKITYIGGDFYRPLEAIMNNIVNDFYLHNTRGKQAILHYINAVHINAVHINAVHINTVHINTVHINAMQKEPAMEKGNLNYYEIHLIYSRHMLLKLYIEKYETSTSKWRSILPLLDVCIQDWFSLKMLINRSNIKKTYLSRETSLLLKILEDEEVLIKCIQELLR